MLQLKLRMRKSKVGMLQRIMPGLLNAETWHFYYNGNPYADSVWVQYRDTAWKGYCIRFTYDTADRLIRCMKYYGDGTVWKDISYRYSSGRLVEIKDSTNRLGVSSTEKFYYNKADLLEASEYFNNDALQERYAYHYTFFPEE